MKPWSHRRRERLDGIEWMLAEAKGMTLLDIGCHRGLIGYEFARWGARIVHGIDNDRAGIVTANKLFEDVDCEGYFVCRDLANGILGIGGFCLNYDTVLLLGVYHKLRRVMDAKKLIVDAVRLCDKYLVVNGFEEDLRDIKATLPDFEVHDLRVENDQNWMTLRRK